MSTTNDPSPTPPPDLPAALQPVLDRLVGIAAGALRRPFLDRLASSITSDAALRGQLRDLARTLLTLTEEPRPVIAPSVATLMSAEPALTPPPPQQTTSETVTLSQPTSNSNSTTTSTP